MDYMKNSELAELREMLPESLVPTVEVTDRDGNPSRDGWTWVSFPAPLPPVANALLRDGTTQVGRGKEKKVVRYFDTGLGFQWSRGRQARFRRDAAIGEEEVLLALADNLHFILLYWDADRPEQLPVEDRRAPAPVPTYLPAEASAPVSPPGRQAGQEPKEDPPEPLPVADRRADPVPPACLPALPASAGRPARQAEASAPVSPPGRQAGRAKWTRQNQNQKQDPVPARIPQFTHEELEGDVTEVYFNGLPPRKMFRDAMQELGFEQEDARGRRWLCPEPVSVTEVKEALQGALDEG